ncbi:DUF2382 domain-containing protein [Streptomyces sp. NPDC003007]
MITREQIPTVLDHPVHDARGDKIGDARHVFFDDVTGEPEWVSVRTGMFGTKESFVPIHDADVIEDHLEVPFAKDQVKDAPNVDVDAGGHLSEQEEQRLYEHYGIDWDAAWQDTRSGTGETTGETTGTADIGQAAGTADTGENAMTRSEEELHIGVERREAGRARLRKYVVTEEQQYTVPVRHEEVRVEREPITDANRDSAMSGSDITEAEHDVTLHEEEPVVETRAVPKERVRLTTEEVTDEETVTGEVRKERMETEGTDDESEDRRRP